MLLSRRDWADAYAKQSASDFYIFEILNPRADISMCHKLHYLQMASEKIAKAYQFRDLVKSQDKLTTSHVAFSKFIENFLSSTYIRGKYKGRDAQLKRFRQSACNIAREIEKLAPAVDSEHSPSNSEYPWEINSKVIIPCDYTYPNLSSLRDPAGTNFLKLLTVAIYEFDKLVIR